MDNAQALVDDFNARRADLPVDYEHQSKSGAKPERAAAPDTASLVQRLIAILNLPADTDMETLIVTIEDTLTKSGTPDPATFVPMEVMHGLLRDRGQQAATTSEGRAAQKVNEAFASDYLTTPMRDWATALCRSDEAAFDWFIATTVPKCRHLIKPSGTCAMQPPGHRAVAVSDQESAICAQLGLKPGSLST